MNKIVVTVVSVIAVLVILYLIWSVVIVWLLHKYYPEALGEKNSGDSKKSSKSSETTAGEAPKDK